MANESLYHFGRTEQEVMPLLTSRYKQKPEYKPRGLWVSVGFAWREWCEGEQWGLMDVRHASEVRLQEQAKILCLHTAKEIDAFTALYVTVIPPGSEFCRFIDWEKVCQVYDGLLITPYCYARRLTPHTMWYYGWDCASGCIWEPSAIKSITARHDLYKDYKDVGVEV